MTVVPLIETARLTLRPMRDGDFPAYAALMVSPRAAFMGGTYHLPAAWGLFCHEVAYRALCGHGALMLDRRDTGDTVGQVGVNAGPLIPETEMGWMLHEGHEAQGYATEGARALRDWAFDILPLASLVSCTHPDNFASQAVALRLGAVADETAARQDPEDRIFRRQREAA